MKHSAGGRILQNPTSSREVSVSSHDSTDWSDRRRMFYNQEEWDLMRSPRKTNSNKVSFEEDNKDNDCDDNNSGDDASFLITQRERQQGKRTLQKENQGVGQPLELRLGACLPPIPSPLDWLKQSLRSHSPSFLWQQHGGQRDVGARHLFSDDDEDDELQEQCFDPLTPIPTAASARQQHRRREGGGKHGEEHSVQRLGTLSSSSSEVILDLPPPPPPLDPSSSPPSSDTRIIAPHVELLSLGSVVEVLLLPPCVSSPRGGGVEDSIAVLCSVDVLKMHSRRFQLLLQAQETEASELRVPTPLDEVWRGTLLMRDPFPFQAAAFLEHLHETRGGSRASSSSSCSSANSKADWNLAWARLSVEWEVEDFRASFSAQMSCHLSLVLSAVERLHWRLNPGVLLGRSVSVAIFTDDLPKCAERGDREECSRCRFPATRLGRVIQATAAALPPSSILVNFQVSNTLTHTSSRSSVASCSTRSEFSDATDMAEEEEDEDGCLLSPSPVPHPSSRRHNRIGSSGGSTARLPVRLQLHPSAGASVAGHAHSSHPLATPPATTTTEKRFINPRNPLLASTSSPQQVTFSHSGTEKSNVAPLSSPACLSWQNNNDVTATCCVEPFWVMSSTIEEKGDAGGDGSGSGTECCWIAPDVFSERLLNTAISAVDKHVFWEMIHALCTYPSLERGEESKGNQIEKENSLEKRSDGKLHAQDDANRDDFDGDNTISLCCRRTNCSSSSSNSSSNINRGQKGMDALDGDKTRTKTKGCSFLQKLLDPQQLAALLARVECRVLWSEGGGGARPEDLLPPAVMKALVRASFCRPPTPLSSSDSMLPGHCLVSHAPIDLRYSTRDTASGHVRSRSFHLKTETKTNDF